MQWKGARNLHISQFYLTISFLNIKPIVKVAQIAIAATSLELHLINFRFNLNVSINVELDCVYVNVILSLQCLDGAGQFSELFCILWKCLTFDNDKDKCHPPIALCRQGKLYKTFKIFCKLAEFSVKCLIT